MPTMHARRRFLSIAFLLVLLLGAPLVAGQGSGGAALAQASPPPLSEAQRRQFEALIRDYLVKNPEVIQEALTELDRRQKDEERKARLKIVQDKTGPLYSSPHHAVLGNPQGDVTLVEFFDYNCGFCKRALADLQKMLAEDKNVRVILKDFPVLGPGSTEAALVALAAKEQLKGDRFLAFHARLLSTRGQVGRAQALDAARDSGADMNKLVRDLDSPAYRGAIEQTIQIADALGLTGTPSYVVGEDIVVGAVGYSELKQRVDNIRKCGQATC
jgi:protein-disulfide isomerase